VTALLFALDAHHGQALADRLRLPLAEWRERVFEDGERKLSAIAPVAGRPCLVVESLYAEEGRSTDAKLLRLAFFIAGLKASGAASVTLIAPYLCYSRKDRRGEEGDPILTRHVAELLEALGVDRLLTIDVHNPSALENAFRIPVRNVGTDALFAERIAALAGSTEVVVVSPDVGGIKRSEAFRRELARHTGSEPGRAIMEKLRQDSGLSGELLMGDPVEGRLAVLIDDLINTGSTLARAANACRRHGAAQVIACASHGLFVPPAAEVLLPEIDRLFVCDSIPPFRLAGCALLERVEVLGTAELLAEGLAGWVG
jgi:ribose-phosphate pyrophosphokinase